MVTLKNVKINESFSEETTCFKADVYYRGKKVAYAYNDGRGGCTFYNAYDNQKELLVEVENYCKSLPNKFYGTFEDKQTLESVIDDLIWNKLKERDDKKIEKLCLTNIVFGVPNGYSYKQIGFKGKPKIEDIKKTPQGRLALDNLIKRIKSELKDGEIIFNKNLS
jgi:hypothetical protein